MTSVALGAGAPLVAALPWGVFAFPGAPATPPAAAMIRVVCFLAAALALGTTGHPRLAATFLILVLLNSALLHFRTSPRAGRVPPLRGKTSQRALCTQLTRQTSEHTANTVPATHPGGSSQHEHDDAVAHCTDHRGHLPHWIGGRPDPGRSPPSTSSWSRFPSTERFSAIAAQSARSARRSPPPTSAAIAPASRSRTTSSNSG